ncbi:MAG TPA: tyrosine--tRNA ligase [Bacteroidia bacterium]|nr:tyrosine--tRNA ligase [Bacteroidia bacterium]
MKNFVEELRWRRMLQDVMPGTEELLNKEMVTGYIGFDPTADSLGVGNLVQIMTLLHFQRCGHKPIALVGGATGMVGDPSGKSAERNLLSEEILAHNQACQKKQLEKFLDFDCGVNSASIVNNYDWFKNISFLDFIRDTGKHITVNYMMAKDSVKNRIAGEDREGMSFTEFTYQLVQGYDFYYLWKHNGVRLQMGGSDQWGNIVTGTELIRRKDGGEAWALTTPLIKKADGTKFGKSESGNVWLDPKRTSPYEFYQFWLNAGDDDAGTYIRIFTLKTREEIEALEVEHNEAKHLRALQKALAEDITTRVHGETGLKTAVAATEVLFGKGTIDQLTSLTDEQFLSVFVGAGVAVTEVAKADISAGLSVIELIAKKAELVTSNGEAIKLIKGNGLSLNKVKVTDQQLVVNDSHLLNGKYILLQKGKKDYCLVKVV